MGLNDEIKNPMEEATTEQQLNLTYLLDTSGSMIGEKINQLNLAMQEAVDVAEETAVEREVKLRMRVIEFNNGAKWICGTDEMNGKLTQLKNLLPEIRDKHGTVDLSGYDPTVSRPRFSLRETQ